ncbi:signal peptidase I [Kingella negevensis]|uniref:Signal peptidase I n=1 Tax=Kingella negevensis TaxID=1522312 RepID=A0A238TFV0_9NEIS|nr:signal peptidase I [Kingella negevensis]MDK4680557.1 signal peptidase I [Kingella negevensis]MDK4681720.1 signal peptidase I [Kingella negevensis]MDK4684717.1 signal peptidase I [Kingella negevensis]MDK4689918.1 signal peptidase I [Kingella negevensis]MDK4692738.1 signal peptidase I [Kingella negevensis]
MESNQILYAAITAAIAGAIMLFSGSKQRNALGEWGNGVQWGYLLIMIGVFGILSAGAQWSFTAVLLTYTVFTGITCVWRKAYLKTQPENAQDNNHFRDYMAGFFPIIAIVFILRTFIAEPFQIPSSSMRPGLVKGDFILVNKFGYGIRIPVLNTVAIPTGKVQRGDVVVFNYPVEPNTNYIKRIVAVGGDTVEYKNKILTVNGQTSIDTPAGNYQYLDDQSATRTIDAQTYQSQFAGKTFNVLKESEAPSVSAPVWNRYQNLMSAKGFQSGLEQNCQYAEDGSAFKCTVPEGKYFVMGDNRDSSADSRYWGFVDDKLMVGKAFMIWMNFSDMKRIGNSIN